MYFSNFPYIKYDFSTRTDKDPIIDTIQDVSAKVNLFITGESMETLCHRYFVSNGELPEHVAFKFYGTTQLAWTIMYINKMGDINQDWPMGDAEVIAFAKEKYGVNNLNKVHHYEKLPEKIWMDQNYIIDNYGAENLEIVTNLDYETYLNEQKRFIYVIKPDYVGRFISTFNSKLA